ncbi:MAG: TolC family protein [Vicinamibacterales bacterium]
MNAARVGCHSVSTRLVTCVVLCLVTGAAPATAQPVPLALSLQDAIDRAIETSHRLAELEARRRAAAAGAATARAADRPLLDVVGGYSRTNHVEEFGLVGPDGKLRVIYPDVPNNLVGRLDVRWPLYTAGRTEALVVAADAESKASAVDQRTARADLVLEVTRTYWAAVSGREAVRTLRDSLARIDGHRAEAQARLDGGFVPPSEVLTVEAQQASERAQLVDAETVRDQTLVLLRHFIGASPGTPIDLVQAASVPEAGPAATPAAAAPERPEHEALALRLTGAAARVAAARADSKPQLALTGGLDYSRPNARRFPRRDEWQDSWDVGISLSWPIFDGGRTKARVEAANAQADALREQLAELDARVAVDVEQRRLEVAASRARIDAAASAVRAATEARRVMRERYAAGVATNTDVLDAEALLLRTDLDHTRATVAARVAEAQLTRALGR